MSGQDVSEVETCLTSQCLAFCQTLANHGQDFKFSLKIGVHFSFSLDTKVKTPAPVARKQKSPSEMRRNARRRKTFLASKETDTPTEETTNEDDTPTPPPFAPPPPHTTPASPSPRTSPTPPPPPSVKHKSTSKKDVSCELCDFETISERELNTHMDNRHNNIGQLDGNTSIDSDISCAWCENKGKKENMVEDEDDDENDWYFCNQTCLTEHNEYE